MSIFGGKNAWTGREHVTLLEAAELYSYGNWDLVAKAVKTRTAEGNSFIEKNVECIIIKNLRMQGRVYIKILEWEYWKSHLGLCSQTNIIL